MFFFGQAWLKVAVLVFILHFPIDFIRCQIEIKILGAGGLNFHETLAYFLGRRNDALKPILSVPPFANEKYPIKELC